MISSCEDRCVLLYWTKVLKKERNSDVLIAKLLKKDLSETGAILESVLLSAAEQIFHKFEVLIGMLHMQDPQIIYLFIRY